MASYSQDEFVCGACFNDDGLKEFVSAHAGENECSFCGAVSDEPIAAPIDEVIDYIGECIGRYYDDPANTLPYESAEGGYQGTTYTTEEVLEAVELDFPNDHQSRLYDAVCSGLPNDLWSDAEPFALSRDEQLSFSWEEFCRVIKHERRYFFAQRKPGKDSELYSPSEILRLIFSYADEAGAFVQLPRSTKLYRARQQAEGESLTTAGKLGPPPVECAIQANRMSPPGIVMMYASEDEQTALAETAMTTGTYAIGEFVTERDALILDFTRLPSIPSIFTELSDALEYDPRPRLGFLHRVSREMSRSIARDDRMHIEYVPTQVVTEYIRTVLTTGKGAVEGIRYRSSRKDGETSLVLFADQHNLILEKEEQPEFYFLWKDCWLRLTTASSKTISNNDIEAWTQKNGCLFPDF